MPRDGVEASGNDILWGGCVSGVGGLSGGNIGVAFQGERSASVTS